MLAPTVFAPNCTPVAWTSVPALNTALRATPAGRTASNPENVSVPAANVASEPDDKEKSPRPSAVGSGEIKEIDVIKLFSYQLFPGCILHIW